MSKALIAFFKSPANWPFAAIVWVLAVLLTMAFAWMRLENASLKRNLTEANEVVAKLQRQQARALDLILDQRDQLQWCSAPKPSGK